MKWILNTKVIVDQNSIKSFIIGDSHYSPKYLDLRYKDFLAQHGIYPFNERKEAMNIIRYSELKAVGKVTLIKEYDEEQQKDRYYLEFTHYDHITGGVTEADIRIEVTLQNIQDERARLSNERNQLLAQRDSLDELITDAQAL